MYACLCLYLSLHRIQVFSSVHGDYFRALAGAKSVSKQIEYMKEYGSAAPVLSDFSTLSDLDIMGEMQTADQESGPGSGLESGLELGPGSMERSALIMVRTADDCMYC